MKAETVDDTKEANSVKRMPEESCKENGGWVGPGAKE